VVAVAAAAEGVDLGAVLADLGQRGMSRVLVEGGARVFGSLFAAKLADRVMAFVAPRIVGGAGALGPVGGAGVARMQEALALEDVAVRRVGPDLMVEGRAGEY
jgi:diaminohydroxyphosphoribosylaminopyrimidine deaminase/5-amino-6-(5-phosphoribosylamino)uracil reductase